MTDPIIPPKRCTKCGEEKPATAEYFYSRKSVKDGFHGQCKACMKVNHKLYQQQHAEILSEKSREWRQANQEYLRDYTNRNRDKINQQQRERYKKSRHTKAKAYRIANKDKIASSMRLWRESNRERLLDYGRNYRSTNRDKRLQYSRRYHVENRDKIANRYLERKTVNPYLFRLIAARRRARLRSLPDTFTELQWESCLQYWHNTCAVCGYPFNDLLGIGKPHADHWIPLAYKGADNPGTVAANMICLCDKCNFSKNDTSPEKWLVLNFGKRKAKIILMRIEAYFEWAKHQ